MGLQGITITNGYYDGGAAVICYSYQNPIIDNCIFSNNISTGPAGAVLSLEGRPVLTNCRFFDNSAVKGGAIAAASMSRLTVQECVFSGNRALEGGALYCEYADTTMISHCTFAHNSATLGANICFINDTPGPQTIESSILAFGSDSNAVHWDGLGSLTLSCVDIFGNAGGDWIDALADQQNINGNMNLDPRFCGNASSDSPYSIAENSPCAEANNPECGLIGALPVGCSPTAGAEEPPLVSDFHLRGCFPNPFNPVTTVSFELALDSDLTLTVFDVHGRLVQTMADGFYPAGEYGIIWRGKDHRGREVGSGVYFAKLKIGRRSEVRKMVLLR